MNFKSIWKSIIVFIFLSVMVLSASAHAATITYTYDNLNRLTKVDYGNGTTTEYTYDAAGNRMTLLSIDDTPPSNPSNTLGYDSAIKTTTLTSGNWYNYSAPYFEWNGASDSSGIAGYYVYFGTSSTADPVTAGTYQTSSNYSISMALTSDTTYYLLIKAKDNSGNIATGTYMAFAYKYDNIAPDTSITSQPSNIANATSVSFNFTSTEAGSTFQCQMDSGSWSFCTSPRSYTGLTEGDHAFYVKATDAAGNTDPTPASFTWTIDATPPSNPTNMSGYDSSIKTTTLTSGNWYNYSAPYFEWNGASDSSGIAGYYVYFGTSSTADPVTAGTYQTSSNYSVSMALTSDTTYYLLIKAKDNPGNIATGTYMAFAYKYDNIAPDTAISAQPSNPTNSTTASFSFTSTETGSSFKCQMDSGGYSACTSPQLYTGLTEGSHTFCARATDHVGNPDSTPACYTWTIDTTAPDTSISAQPLNLSDSASATFSFASTETDSNFECQMDSGGYTDCTSPMLYTGLTEGSHTFTVRAKDAAGNTDATPASYTWTIDLTAPVLTLSTLTDGAVTNNSILNMAGTVTDNTWVQGLEINGDTIAVNADGSFSYALQLTAGFNTVTTIATDMAGNKTTDTRVITLDVKAPALAIVSPADNSKTAVSIITVTGTIDESAAVEIRLNNGATQAASIIGNIFTANLNLVTGINTIEITAIDLAGNKATQKRTVTYDDASPSLEVTSPNQDIKTNQSSMVIRGTVSDTLTAVTITIKVDSDTFTPQVTDGQFEQAVTFTSERTYQITITATDEVGNATMVQRNIIYDITGPPFDTVVTTPTNNSSQTISGSMEENATITVTSSSVTIGVVTYPTSTTWSVTISGMAEGSNTVTITARDAAGNEIMVMKEIILDTIVPDTSITAQPPSLTNSTSASFNFTSTEAGSTFQCQLDGGGYSSCASPMSYSGISEGSHTFEVRASDPAGNTDPTPASYIWTIDTTPPSVTIGPVLSPTNLISQAITGTVEAGAALNVATDTMASDGAATVTGTMWNYTITGLVESVNVITVTATDSAGGNTASVTSSITLDTTAPDTSISTKP